jgi:hypothetical protein
MRRFILFLGVLAFVTSSAMAASLIQIPEIETGTNCGNAITPDGKYVGGQSPSKGFVWDATNGTRQPWGGSYLGSVTGIGYRQPVGGPQELVLHGSDAGWHGMPASTDGGVTWSKRRRTFFPNSNSAPDFGPYNTLGGNTTSDKAYAALWWQSGGTYRQYVDEMSGNPWTWQIDSKDAPTEAKMHGCSSAGLAVGYRKDVNGKQAYRCQFDGDGGLAAGWVTDLDADGQSVLYDASDDAEVNTPTGRVGGFSQVSDARTGWFPYVYDYDTSTASELPILVPGEDYATTGVVYGMAPDGRYAVGMDYSNGIELAVMLNLTDPNPANWTVLDLTQFATDNGILGNFTYNLRRATAMGYNDQGQPVITGRGVINNPIEYRAFVLTIPEPATLSFLALGGLMLLRRRR